MAYDMATRLWPKVVGPPRHWEPEAFLEYLVAAKASQPQPRNPFVCLLNGKGPEVGRRIAGTFPITHGDSLHTYRMAMATTAEYTALAGGVSGAVSRIVATMNRVNGIYERELAVRMTVATGTSGNPTALIYTDSASDPYTDSDPNLMIEQNQANLSSVIGTAGYDIGHVFSTFEGGVAFIGSPCDPANKGKGVTGSSSPIGEIFDVDYVAHEIGHQFGGNHTFNCPNPFPLDREPPELTKRFIDLVCDFALEQATRASREDPP